MIPQTVCIAPECEARDWGHTTWVTCLTCGYEVETTCSDTAEADHAQLVAEVEIAAHPLRLV